MLDVTGAVSEEAMHRIAQTLRKDAPSVAATRVSVSSSSAQQSQLRLAVKGAHTGLAAYLCSEAGLEIRALRRIRLGRVALGALPLGHWRYLSEAEKF